MIRGDDEFQRKLTAAIRPLHTSTDLATIRKARQDRDDARIDELSEAFENLAVAVSAIALARVDNSRPTHPMVTEYLGNSREWMRNAIRAFITPNLHLVEGQARQLDRSIPLDDRVRCARCHQTSVCRDVLCADWHAAVKHHVGRDEPEELPPDDRPRAA